jgi:NAD(P)-dependent dehydrogenase (short-subunit alcohol dehydrogenase family)
MTTSMPKTVLITGGAKRIGKVITETLSADGWAVAIHYFGSSDEAVSLAKSITDANGQAEVFSADLNDPDATEDLISAVVDSMGPLGALINNASIFEKEGWDDVTPDSWAQHLEINLHAPFVLSQALARALPDELDGAIVNIIDQRVFNLTPEFVSYTVSKTGLWTLTQTLAMALAPRIRVNGVGPGPTLPNERQTEEIFERQVSSTPLQRQVEPDDIAAAVKYLLSARSVTGEMIAVDSGEHLGWTQSKEGQSLNG